MIFDLEPPQEGSNILHGSDDEDDSDNEADQNHGDEDTPAVSTIGKLTRACIEVRKKITAYNNAVSFVSMGVEKLDTQVRHFCFRIQGALHHQLGPLQSETGFKPRFVQIFTADASSQQQVDHRLHWHPQEDLDPGLLRRIQRAMKSLNPFSTVLKNCVERLEAQPHPSQSRIMLRQRDPKRSEQGTHGLPSSDEVAAIIGNLDEVEHNKRIDKDIVCATKEGGLQRISYAHSAYLPLRFPLIFQEGEPGWKYNIPLQGNNVVPANHTFGDRNRNTAPNTMRNDFADVADSNPNDDDEDDDAEPQGQTVQGPTTGVGGAKSITLHAMYKKMIQVNFQSYTSLPLSWL